MDSLARLAFCPPGLPFFDRSDAGDGAGPEFVDGLAVPTGWHGQANEEWMNLAPPGAAPPAQGWKIHASAVAENAAHVLEVIAKYCFTHDVMFKFLRTPAVLQRRNGKYADRGASGKFVTIYPGSEEQFGQILIELGGLLDGEPGPYILSDLRWRDGPLYVRYGGIVPLVVRGPDGRPVYCLRTPAGELVEDRRGPGFRPPEWVSLPPVLDAAIAARNAGTLRNFPYRVDRALHFSNGGGVYRATAVPDGREVLVREARPLAGLDAGGRDAVARLAAERDALQRLSGVDGIPALIDFRRGHEHRYLIREYVPGRSLAQEMIRRNPLFAAREPDRADPGWADHAEWALAILARVDHTLGEMHRRGVVFHDLHPANVLVRPDGGIALIDFETATSVDDPAPQLIGAPGFVAPDGYTGTAVDRYALGCLRLVVFAPLAAAVPLGRTKVAELLAFIGELFPLPAGFAGSVWADLGPAFAAPALAGRPVTPPATTRASRVAGPAGDAAAGRPAGRVPDSRAVASGILATATPDRADRLYPGDARQFTHPEGGVDLATGAAGVQLALAATGRPVPADHVDWL
uniref:class III lanthionine synthetase LanKC n=1 Tax=Nakamurella sp. TaxID=1869182 RepID=UPI003B3B63BD